MSCYKFVVASKEERDLLIREGYWARALGALETDNPYSIMEDRSMWWYFGWRQHLYGISSKYKSEKKEYERFEGGYEEYHISLPEPADDMKRENGFSQHLARQPLDPSENYWYGNWKKANARIHYGRKSEEFKDED